MIYICKGCDGACKGCNKACDECGKACGSVCDPCCKVMDRPLGGYVLLTALLTIPAFGCAAGSLANEDVLGCEAHPLMVLCGADAALSILHLAMAVYLQNRLVHGLQRSSFLSAPGAEAAAVPGAGGQGPQALSSKELMQRAGQIVLYDVGFCLYVFVFVGAFVLQLMGFGWIGGCAPETPLPYAAASLLVLFALMAVSFGFLWYFAMVCDDCCGSLTRPAQPSAQPQRRQRRGILGTLLGFLFGNTGRRQQGPPPTVMGTPVQQHMGAPAAYATAAPPAGYPVGQQQQPVQGIPAPSAPPPPQQQPQQQTAQQAAAQAAAGGLRMAGDGLQAAGRWLGGRGKQ